METIIVAEECTDEEINRISSIVNKTGKPQTIIVYRDEGFYTHPLFKDPIFREKLGLTKNQVMTDIRSKANLAKIKLLGFEIIGPERETTETT